MFRFTNLDAFIFLFLSYILAEKKSLAAQRTEKIVCIGGRTKLSGRVATEDILFLLESGESGGKVFGFFFIMNNNMKYFMGEFLELQPRVDIPFLAVT